MELDFKKNNDRKFERESFLTLPKGVIEARFIGLEKDVSKRWDKLTLELDFPKYSVDKSDILIKQEFEKFNLLRNRLHCNSAQIPHQSQLEFTIAQNILIHHRYRQPSCITFEFSKADDSYNCSCLEVHGRKYFALDGPSDQTIKYFYKLLLNWNVGMLVSLTGESEQGVQKCYPYWNQNTFEKDGDHFLGLPIEDEWGMPIDKWLKKTVPFLHLDNWKDHAGFDVEKLVEYANLVRKRINKESILAIHCSGGVGRTGTFLAVVALLDEIDDQLSKGFKSLELNLSIPKLFLKLNFYRRLLVAEESQYICLYRAVDYYLKINIKH